MKTVDKDKKFNVWAIKKDNKFSKKSDSVT